MTIAERETTAEGLERIALLCEGGYVLFLNPRDGRAVDRPTEKMVALLRSAAETVRAGGWRPIATAPRDGTRVLFYAPIPERPARVGGAIVGRYSERYGWQVIPGHWPIQPTHWQPLPAGPREETT